MNVDNDQNGENRVEGTVKMEKVSQGEGIGWNNSEKSNKWIGEN